MLTQILTKEDLTYLQKRFSYFYDAVVESWDIDWVKDRDPRVKSRIRVLDFGVSVEETDSGVWCQVVLTMEDCELFRVVESSKDYYRVTANGIYTLMEQTDKTLFGVDFGHFNETPKSISQLMESPCCVVSSRLFWEVL